jgi:electron transport complex protein RnfD
VTVFIRYFGGLTEGIMYAILLGNSLVPMIDQYTQPRVFGEVKRKSS